MKSVLISIRPKWVELIASGKKTVEIRKTRPKLETPFKCYIYETKGKVERPRGDEDGYIYQEGHGAVVGEFVCDSIKCFSVPYPAYQSQMDKEIMKNSCVDYWELHRYAYHDSLYGWHISALKMYDKPKKLSELHSDCGQCGYVNVRGGNCDFIIKRPPQSWCYVRCAA